MTEEKKELIEILLADRHFIYSLLHKLVSRNPDREMLDIFVSEQSAQAFSLLSTEEGDLLSKAPLFIEDIRADLNSDPDFMDKLQSEYTRLFVGPLTLIAPPWESVYSGEDAMLFQVGTLMVREFYRSFNLIPEGYPHVADDSLSLELAFMTELASRSMTAFEDDNTAVLKINLDGSQRFLSQHLLKWIPKFLEKISGSMTDYMYPQLCALIDAFLKKDMEIVGIILTEL